MSNDECTFFYGGGGGGFRFPFLGNYPNIQGSVHEIWKGDKKRENAYWDTLYCFNVYWDNMYMSTPGGCTCSENDKKN